MLCMLEIFFWYDFHTPRNVSIFMVFESGPLDSEERVYHILYHLAEQQGKAK